MTRIGELFVDFLVFITIAAVVLSVALFTVGETIEHFTPSPAADELYGCTIKQQAPNGDCP